MTKANAEIKYDPELPFAFVGTSGKVVARFSDFEFARRFGVDCLVGSVVDTNPKPKIPEDAEFVTWQMNGANEVAIFADFNPLRPWEWAGQYFSEEDLLKVIGDAEVTVLVRKDET